MRRYTRLNTDQILDEIARRREQQKSWGEASRRRYAQSERGRQVAKEARERYYESHKEELLAYGREWRKTHKTAPSPEAAKRYRESEAGKEAAKRGRQSEKGKAASRRAGELYRHTERGREAARQAGKRYRERLKAARIWAIEHPAEGGCS